MHRVVAKRIWSSMLKRKVCCACGIFCLVPDRKHVTWILDLQRKVCCVCGVSCLVSDRKHVMMHTVMLNSSRFIVCDNFQRSGG